MVQGRGGFGFACETLLIFRGSNSAGDDFDGDGPAEFDIDSFVDGAHAAFSDFPDDFIVRNETTGLEGIALFRFQNAQQSAHGQGGSEFWIGDFPQQLLYFGAQADVVVASGVEVGGPLRGRQRQGVFNQVAQTRGVIISLALLSALSELRPHKA